MEVRGGRADAAPTLDSVSVEYLKDWYEPVMDAIGEGASQAKQCRPKRVKFNEIVTVRPISAAGRGRPTCESGKIRRLWADTDDEERGEGCNSIVAEGESADENFWEEMKLNMDENADEGKQKKEELEMIEVMNNFESERGKMIGLDPTCSGNLNTANSPTMIESPLTRDERAAAHNTRRPWAASIALPAREHWSSERQYWEGEVCSFREGGLLSRFWSAGGGSYGKHPICWVERSHSEFTRRGSAGNRGVGCSRSWMSSSSNARSRASPPRLRLCSDQHTLFRPADTQNTCAGLARTSY